MDDAELERLLLDVESDRVERKASLAAATKIHQAICAFANDLPNHRKPGVVFIGANDDGSSANLVITDELLRTLADMRDNGNIVPIPTMSVQKRTLHGHDVAVIEVQPADAPPVRYSGRTWIRVGPRRAVASREEERRLSEKRRAGDLPFDLQPVKTASPDDLDEDFFLRTYLPATVAGDVLAANDRSVEQQLKAMRFVTGSPPDKPTVVGILVTGRGPSRWIPGAYLQFLRIDGTQLTDPIQDSHELHGPVSDLLLRLDDVLKAHIATAPDFTSGPTEIRRSDYPLVALQQLTRNALMHRDYETTNAPVRVNWFNDRIEIQNPGGPFGQITRRNFGTPGITDYRNPNLAGAMRNLGFVQRFGVGIGLARRELQKNGNPEPEFVVEDNHVLVIVRSQE